jgi:hypothetical protein
MLIISVIVHDDFSHIHRALVTFLEACTPPPKIYVTINSAPSMAEVEKLQAAFPQIQMIINDQVQGFAANHNRVMKLAETPFIALLNDDIELKPSALYRLVQVLQEQPDIGLVVPLIQNPDGTPQLSVFSDPTLLRMIYKISGAGNLTKPGGIVRQFLQRTGIAGWLGVESLNPDFTMRDVPVGRGVCMVLRRETYRQVGGMDEVTRIYGEEYGWHWRMRKAGWRVAFVPEVAVIHYNLAQPLEGWKLAEHRKSILNYFICYRPAWQAKVIRFSIVLFHGFWAAVNLPIHRQRARQHWQAARVGMTWKPDL